MTTAPWRDSKLISRNLINICLLTILTLYVFANLCVCVCVLQSNELKCHVTSVDNQLEHTSRERDEARDLVMWQRLLIERQLKQVTCIQLCSVEQTDTHA